MPGFEDLLNFVLRATNVAPVYSPERCIAVTQSTTACYACVAGCPHEAVRFGRQVEIDDVDCTGCGLCVQLCPSQALEPKLSYQPGASVRCSEVGGSAQSILCLGRLQATDIIKVAAGHGDVTLAHGDCADCPIGVPSILEHLQNVVEDAGALVRQHGRELNVHIEQRTTLEQDRAPEGISRRALLTGGLRSAQRSAAGALAPLENLLGASSEADGPRDLPRELLQRFRIIEAARPAPDDTVPWALPRVDEGCILCPVCTRVCPTDAFSRDFEPVEGQGPLLRLEPERCLDCGACVNACPVKVIRMEQDVAWSEVSGGSIVAYRDAAGDGPQGSIYR